MSGESRGAYGLRIEGLPGVARWLTPQSRGAPRLTVVAEQGPIDSSPHELDDASANLRLLGGGRLRMQRDERVARFSFPHLVPETDLLHPYLTAACALYWQWAGREALHAGAFAVHRRAVILLGDKEGGKSSTLAHLARHSGTVVLADDLAVLDSGRVLAGPRCIDMRPAHPADPRPADAAAGEPVRGLQRVRINLDDAPQSLPVAVSVVLRWGDALSLDLVPPRERLPPLAEQRSFPPLTGDPAAILALASLPMVQFTRPRDADRIATDVRALLDDLGSRLLDARADELWL